ncbi:MAG: imidazolonepropionase [Myxococcales bacterium]|nr:imidazolonepropionase [Myxococcales bacterium]
MAALYLRARVMTCNGPAPDPLGLVDDGAVLTDGEQVVWVGAAADADAACRALDVVPAERVDLGGRLVTPGLVDCHTHAIFAGDRAAEFAMRARGEGYLEIARAGGGIAATLGPTRDASDATLERLTVDRLMAARATGTTTIEVKSGYDLTVAGELRLLRVIARAGAHAPLAVVPTLLCHLVPPERRADRDDYLHELVTALVPAVAADRLATSVDVYCDDGAFTRDETARILVAARDHGLAVRAHVGQFTDQGAAELAAGLGARSVDHLEQVSAAGIAALAAAGTVAVMLPGACVQLRLPPPPVAALRAAGVPLAVATDLNPGSSYTTSLPLQMWLATTHLAMTVEEAWLGVTRIAARALGLADRGVLAPGARADLVVWNAEHPAAVPYQYGASLVERVITAA